MPEPIPSALCGSLLPGLMHSVAEFLQYTFPSQLSEPQCSTNSSSIKNFGLSTPPNAQNVVGTIASLPIPSPTILSELQFSEDLSRWSSIRYAHLPSGHNANQSTFPPWIVTYWTEVSRLQATFRHPWTSSEVFLKRAQSSWKTPDIRQLCDAAEAALLHLPWSGNTVGFGADDDSTYIFADYLSHRWLRSTHINQQLHLMRLDLKRAGILGCEIMTPDNFILLDHIYKERNTMPYHKDSRRHIYGMGEELASGRRNIAAGVAIVNGNHWIAIVIDIANKTVRYGDSLNGSEPSKILDALAWWLDFHMPSSTFRRCQLPITQQFDSFSCGVLALNAVCHAILPGSPLLPASSPAAITHARLKMFVRTVNLDAQHVRHGLNY